MRPAVIVLASVLLSIPASAREWFVAPGGSGNGDPGSPLGSVQAGIDAAQPGDVVSVAAGTYSERLRSVRAGQPGAPITIRGTAGALVTNAGRVLTLGHPYHVIETLVLDGQYGDDDAVRIETAADGAILRGVEVRRAQRDCIDMGAPANVLIEGCTIHHCLNAAGGRTDAHGIVGGAVRDLTIRNTEIHTFSGDAVQFDPGRASAGWDRITIEGCTFWLAPLPAAENGFDAGVVPGENAIDTKVNASGPLAHLTVRDTVAHGFQNGLISNMAAYNLKERVVAELDRVTIYDSEIALRLRAPADVTVTNAVIYDVVTAVRYEDNIETPRLFSSTLGTGITRLFQAASSNATVVDARNVLVLGTTLPGELPPSQGSLAVDANAFVGAAQHDYRLAAGSPAIDQGIDVPVSSDRAGNARPHGAAHDVGAYEYCDTECRAAPDAGPGGDPDDPAGAGGGCCRTTRTAMPWPALLVVALGLRRRRKPQGALAGRIGVRRH
jgi:hypothetical protein